MGRYAKNRELDSAAYTVRFPMGSAIAAPNDPVTALVRYNETRRRAEMYLKNKWRPFLFGSDIEYPHKDTFYGTGVQTVFGPMRFAYPTGNELFLQVFIHNVWQNPGVAYVVNGYEITFTSPPPDGHPIVILHGNVVGDYEEVIPASWLGYVPIYDPPSYDIVSNTLRAIEIDANLIQYTVTTVNVPDNTVLFYRLVPGTPGITYDDLVDGNATVLYEGNVTIHSNIGFFNVEIQTDTIIDAGERFYVELMTGSINGEVVATSVEYQVIVDDPIPVTYAVSPNFYQVNEGTTIVFTVVTTKVPDGTYLFYRVNADTPPVTDADFVGGDPVTLLSNTFVISGNVGYFTITPVADGISDRGERFWVGVYTGSPSGNLVANTSIIQIGVGTL